MDPATIGALASAVVAVIAAVTALVAQIRHVNGPAHRGVRLPPKQ